MLGLGLSGGGFRATLFHVGSLLRINQAGLLPDIDEVTSVSGGSIIAAYLGLKWSELQFDQNNIATNFDEVIVKPIRDFCGRTIDVGTILGGVLNPIRHPSNLLINKYNKFLFGDKTLQDLPPPGHGPRFTIYATSLQTGASVRFTRELLGEYHLGEIKNPEVSLSLAVAASSAFPPPLCPVKLVVDPSAWVASNISDQHHDSYMKNVMWLGDGGIYDNLGLERLSKTCDQILLSDAGAPFKVNRKFMSGRFSQVARTKRALDIMGTQVRSLRVRRLLEQFTDNSKQGAYWGIATKIDAYPLIESGLKPALMIDSDTTASIADIRTRLNKFKEKEQVQLINWGYALADAGLRARFDSKIAAVENLPFNERMV